MKKKNLLTLLAVALTAAVLLSSAIAEEIEVGFSTDEALTGAPTIDDVLTGESLELEGLTLQNADGAVAPLENDAIMNEARIRINKNHFPDSVFRSVVKNHYDVDDDGYLSHSEVATVKEMWIANNRKCTSLKGIEYFVNLEYLMCHGDSLTALDLSKNKKLKWLTCSDNKLKKLNVSKNTKLESLLCENNKLITLDVSRCPKLESLYCYDNLLSRLDLGKLEKLDCLRAESNELEVLDITGNTKLVKVAQGTPSFSDGDVHWAKNGLYPYDMSLDEDILVIADDVLLYGKADVELAENSVSLGVGEKIELLPVVTPAEAFDFIRFKSSDKSVVKVDAKTGKITAKKVGSATIDAVIAGNLAASCDVTVQKAPSKVKLNSSSKTLRAGATYQLKATLPKNTASWDIEWSSSNKKVAIVNQNGLVTAISEGSAKITVKTFNGRKATCKLTVKSGEQSARINLLDYMGVDVDVAGKKLGLKCTNEEMHYYGNKYMEIGTYSNYSDHGTDYIYLNSDPNGKYRFGGFYIGMTPSEAKKLLFSEGWSRDGVSDDRAFYSKMINHKQIKLSFSPYNKVIKQIYCSLVHEEDE